MAAAGDDGDGRPGVRKASASASVPAHEAPPRPPAAAASGDDADRRADVLKDSSPGRSASASVPAHEAPRPPAAGDAASPGCCPLLALPAELRRNISSRLVAQADAASFGKTCRTAYRELHYRTARLQRAAGPDDDAQRLRSALKRAETLILRGGPWGPLLARILAAGEDPGPAPEICPSLRAIHLSDEELFTGTCRCDRKGSVESFNQLRGLRGLPAGCRIILAHWYCPPPDFFRPPAPGEPAVLARTYALAIEDGEKAQEAARALPRGADLQLLSASRCEPARWVELVSQVLSALQSRALSSLQIGPDWWEAACICYR